MKYRNPKIIIQEIYVLLDELGKVVASDGSLKDKSLTKSRVKAGITESIIDLINSDFFNEPKELSEIRDGLHSEGVNKPTTSLMKPLLRLVKGKILKREMVDGKWKYQRR